MVAILFHGGRRALTLALVDAAIRYNDRRKPCCKSDTRVARTRDRSLDVDGITACDVSKRLRIGANTCNRDLRPITVRGDTQDAPLRLTVAYCDAIAHVTGHDGVVIRDFRERRQRKMKKALR